MSAINSLARKPVAYSIFQQRRIAFPERRRGIGRLQELLHFMPGKDVGEVAPLPWGLDLRLSDQRYPPAVHVGNDREF